MKNLAEFAQDSRAKQVLLALETSIASAEGNPLLNKLQTATLSLREFGFVAKVRLNAATNFIPFLSATEEKMHSHGQWPTMADALRKNLNEELGIVDGRYDMNEDHDVWRDRFRSGLERVLSIEGIFLEDINDAETTSDISIFYGERMKEMPKERSIAALTGAFTVLEGILEKEFSAMLTYIKTKVTNLTQDELLYITHHAGHEHRHLKEAAIPLLLKCTASPHIVPEVIAGIEEMTKLRLQDVLERIDINLWKAEPRK